MTYIEFKDYYETKAWILDNIQQHDARYDMGLEVINPLTYFLMNKAIIVEEKQLPEWSDPPKNEIQIIRGPQKEHKYIAIKLFEAMGQQKENILAEVQFRGYKPDVYTEIEDKIIAVECCSCAISKVIDYLEYQNTELWILTTSDALPTIKIITAGIHWYTFKRGENWDRIYKVYEQSKINLLKSIVSPLDTLYTKKKSQTSNKTKLKS